MLLKKSAKEWLELDKKKALPGPFIQIANPTGWQRGDGVTSDTPISHKEFIERLKASTVRYDRESSHPFPFIAG